MIKANHSQTHHWLLDTYLRFILKSDFRDIIITGDVKPDNRSILLIPNHFSWWDGFFAWHLNEKLLRKSFHIMMLEPELSKRMFFTRVGAFSVNLFSKSMLETLEYTAELLKNQKNLVIIFPQGKLGSHHHSEVKFQKGVERILEKVEGTKIVFSAFLVDYYGFRKPTLTISLKEYEGEKTLTELERAYNNHLKNSILNQDNLFLT